MLNPVKTYTRQNVVRLALLSGCLVFSSMLFAQRFDLGIMAGASNYQGDLAPSSVWTSVGTTHLSYGIYGRYNFNSTLAARIGFTKGTLSGNDARSTDPGRALRKLSFRSDIKEFSLVGEFNILPYLSDRSTKRISPYLFGGIALFTFNPKALHNEEWVELQPLGTEGQGLPQYPEKNFYGLTQISIPIGGGIKFAVGESWTVVLESGARKTFTDYLDDVSGTYISDGEMLEARGPVAAALANPSGQPRSAGYNRGDPADKDWYIFSGVSVYFHFMKKGKLNFPSPIAHKVACPKNFY